MSDSYNKFVEDSEKKAFDKVHRATLAFNISRYDAAVVRGKEQYSNLNLAKERAAHIKNKVITEMAKYLVDFESAFQSRGGKVIWAQDGDEAVSEVLKIVKKQQATHVVKSKTMVTEEISLNEHLEKAGIESLETDLGEYIVQLAGEKPYHSITTDL